MKREVYSSQFAAANGHGGQRCRGEKAYAGCTKSTLFRTRTARHGRGYEGGEGHAPQATAVLLVPGEQRWSGWPDVSLADGGIAMKPAIAGEAFELLALYKTKRSTLMADRSKAIVGNRPFDCRP